MLASLQQRRVARMIALALVGLAVVALAPARPARGQIGVIQYLDNSQGEFANGVFERTALGPYQSSAIAEDQAGIVQLAPAGILNPWDIGVPGLPEPISDARLVALGEYLYLIGGERETGRSDKVFRAKVDRVTGRSVPFDNSGLIWKEFTITPEEAVRHSGCARFTAAERTTAARTRAAAVGLQTSSASNAGFIYYVGGLVSTTCRADLSSPLVQIGVVNAAGEITSWIKAPYLPTPTGATTVDTTNPLGYADPMVTIVRTSTNERFIYVVGGVSFNPFTSINPSRIYRTVFYAKIEDNGTTLTNPLDGSTTQPWARAADIQLFDVGETGLRDGVAVPARSTRLNTNSNPPVVQTVDGFFIAGGCYRAASCSATENHDYVLKATISDPATGAITWDSTPSQDNTPVSLPGRSSLGGAFYNGKLYVVAGSTDGASSGAQFTVPTAFFDSDLNAIKLSGTTFFVGPDDRVLLAGAGGDSGRRMDVGVAVMNALPPENQTGSINAAWIYVAGGRNESNTISRQDSLYIGKIGGADEADDAVRTRDGWYYSSIEEVTISGALARVLSVRWTAEIDRSANQNADIRVEFRKTVTADRQCPDESVFDTNADPDAVWRAVDGNSSPAFLSESNTPADPFNTVDLEETFPGESFEATCLQFRAFLLQNGTQAPADPSDTPLLLSFSLEKILAGAPDLKLKDFNITRLGAAGQESIDNVQISIENLNSQGADKTPDVDDFVGNQGNFYVHLCLAKAPPGADAPALNIPPTLANSPGNRIPACAVAYYKVNNNQMTAGATVNLPAAGWQNPNAPYNTVDLRDLFAEPGVYRVGVTIDHENLIPEGPDGEANNRGETTTSTTPKTIVVEINAERQTVLRLPIIFR